MGLTAYNAGATFERLLRKVYSSSEAQTLQSFMRNAVAMENGEELPKNLGSQEKQFMEAKEKLVKTIGKLAQTSPYSQEAVYFEPFLSALKICKSTTCLMDVVKGALIKANQIDLNG